MEYRLSGLVAATYTPMDDAGRLNLVEVPSQVERLIGEGVTGLYVCGSTGEGASLTGSERRLVAEAFVAAAARRVPVIVQVGHNSVSEAAELAAHAQKIGADVVSAVAPSYFQVGTVELLVDCMESIASAAPNLPFYYYHIPALTGTTLDMARFLEQAGTRICNLAGIKYTCSTVHEYQICHELQNRRFDIVWGADEMLLSALVVGARGAIGSTYNIAAPLYQRLIAAFESGDLEEARHLQYQSVTLIRTIYRFPFHPAMKRIMTMLGTNCGRCRLPQPSLSEGEVAELHERLDQIGFFNWGRPRAD